MLNYRTTACIALCCTLALSLLQPTQASLSHAEEQRLTEKYNNYVNPEAAQLEGVGEECVDCARSDEESFIGPMEKPHGWSERRARRK